MNTSPASVVALLALILGAISITQSAVALYRSRRLPPKAYRELEGEARALIADLDSLAEKLSMQVARDARRRTASARRSLQDDAGTTETQPEGETVPRPNTMALESDKANLWAIANNRGLGRGGR